MNGEHDPSRVETARRNLAGLRVARTRLVARLSATAAELQRRARIYGRDDPRTKEAHAAHSATKRSLDETRVHEREAKRALNDALSESLAPDPAGDVNALSTEFPVALLPVRLETRFANVPGQGPELQVRIYPDEIVADTHEPALTTAEVDAGRVFWNTVWQNPDREPEAWRLLVAQFPATRAAWIAVATTPADLTIPTTGELVFPETELRRHAWSRAAEARVLPDRWLVVATRAGAKPRLVVTRPVEEPLALTLSPDMNPDDPSATLDLSGDGLRIDTEVAWTFDFARAKEVGMAVSIPLKAEELTAGFDRVIVVGVKASLTAKEGATRLAQLLENHHYTRGLAFVRQGTPTNNTRRGPTGFPPPDPGGSYSFSIERGAPLVSEGSDAVVFTRALGVPSDLAAHLAGADRHEQQAARAMNDALWPATWGYFLEQMMAPIFDRTAISDARRHFVEYVRGRGPFPAFRVGSPPYGLLPVTSLNRWVPQADATGPDLHLPPVLQTLRGIWASQIARVPRIGRTDDPDGDLLTVLGMDASTREVRVRHVLGRDSQWNLLQFMGVPWAQWFATQQSIARTVMDLLGHPEWDPRIAGMSFASGADLVVQPLVSRAPLSEDEGLAFDYIRWIRTVRSVNELKEEVLPKRQRKPKALLYYLIRHSALTEYARIGFDIHVKHGRALEQERRDPELIGIVPGTQNRLTVWQQFDRPVPGLTGKVPLGQHLLASRRTSDTAQVYDYRDSLMALEGQPTAELDRLLTETLDTCSHRLDAWITSLPLKRLNEMRRAQPAGIYLGGYGWVEDLRPERAGRSRQVTLSDGRTVRAQNEVGGFIHAPSMDHAASAAILRSGYLTRTGDLRTPYAIDLSSQRVRTARWLLDAVRQGQPLGALLGYRLERALHDRQLDTYIEHLRRLYPLVAKNTGDGDEPTETIAARNVVDGLALQKTWREGRLPFGMFGLPIGNTDEADKLRVELRALDNAVDAVADLLTAESVYQIVRGNSVGAAATLDSMTKGVRPPDPEIAHVPRGGTTVTHRVAVVLGRDPLAIGPGWPVAPTPRAAAEPNLDGWVGTLLGDPRDVRCRVSYLDSTGAPGEHEVTLAQLRVRPLDLLAMARHVGTAERTSELDRRVAHLTLVGTSGISGLRITYGPDAAWNRDTIRTFPEALELARAINAVLTAGRALRAEDLARPEGQPIGGLGPEATTRATDAHNALVAARIRLDDAISAQIVNQATLREALADIALFGVSNAFPTHLHGTDDSAGLDLLLSQGRIALAETIRREELASAATDPVEKIHRVFGNDFLFLPTCVPHGAEELNQALAAGPALVGETGTIQTWLQRAARVRPPLGCWRKLRLYAEALGAQIASFEVAQLPHVDGERWIGLPFATEDDRPPSGRLSLVLHRPVAPSGGAEWAGLLLDEWTEVIPNKEETTGIAFHYDDPGAEAAHTVLLAVPPTSATTWELDTLVDTVNETLDLAKLRAVDGDLLGMLGQLLPAVYLASNAANETVASDFVQLFVRETIASSEDD